MPSDGSSPPPSARDCRSGSKAALARWKDRAFVATVIVPVTSVASGREHLLELLDGMEKMKDYPVKQGLQEFTIFPHEPRPAAQKK
jgi:hypothetical protein